MALVRWDPWSELAALQRDVQELFGRTAPFMRPGRSLIPPMDAFQDGDELVIRLEVPGYTPDQIEVNFDKGVLTISGERSDTEEISDDRWLRRERSSGSFTRTMTLPEGVDPQKIKATCANGLLELRVPHTAEQRPQRIPVSAAESTDTVDVTEQPAAAGNASSS